MAQHPDTKAISAVPHAGFGATVPHKIFFPPWPERRGFDCEGQQGMYRGQEARESFALHRTRTRGSTLHAWRCTRENGLTEVPLPHPGDTRQGSDA